MRPFVAWLKVVLNKRLCGYDTVALRYDVTFLLNEIILLRRPKHQAKAPGRILEAGWQKLATRAMRNK